MIKRATGKLFIISVTLSILLHTGFFAGMFFSGDSFYKKPEKNYSLLYNVSLEYIRLPSESREKTGLENENKPAPREIRQKQKTEESGDVTNKNTDTSPILETSQKEPETDFLPEIDGSSDELLTGYPIDSSNTNINTIVADQQEGYNNPVNMDIIFKELSDKIQENIIYPPAARRRGIEGTVMVFFVIDREGCLLKSKVEKSSGYSILDKAALKVIERSLPHPHTLNRQVELRVSIIYSLE